MSDLVDGGIDVSRPVTLSDTYQETQAAADLAHNLLVDPH